MRGLSRHSHRIQRKLYKYIFVDTNTFLRITVKTGNSFPHLNSLAKKFNSAFRQIKQLTDTVTARLIYFVFFHSIMTYVWSFNVVSTADIDNILQKCAIRATYGIRFRKSFREIFSDTDIITLNFIMSGKNKYV